MGYAFPRSSDAGPMTTWPSVSNLEPWQGQSQVRSMWFQRTMHPRCVQMAEQRWRLFHSSR